MGGRGGTGCVQDLDRGDGFTGEYICQNLANPILYIDVCSLLCAGCASINLFIKTETYIFFWIQELRHETGPQGEDFRRRERRLRTLPRGITGLKCAVGLCLLWVGEKPAVPGCCPGHSNVTEHPANRKEHGEPGRGESSCGGPSWGAGTQISSHPGSPPVGCRPWRGNDGQTIPGVRHSQPFSSQVTCGPPGQCQGGLGGLQLTPAHTLGTRTSLATPDLIAETSGRTSPEPLP